MSDRVHLLVKGENPPGPVEAWLYDEETSLSVRDLTTRAVIRIRAKEISCYLHTLFLGDRTYKILNVRKVAHRAC